MKSFLLFFPFLLFSCSITAQTTPKDSLKTATQFVITKNDGTEYIGLIISDDGREVLIETETIGKIYLPKADIKSMVKIENKSKIVNGEYRSEGPFTTRYAFTNNALPIKKGENYAMINLFGPEVHFAVSNHLNVGVMSTWIASPLVLALKYTFKTHNPHINFSAGTLMGTSGYLNSFKSYGGLHWLSMTLGDRMNNLTFSGGYGYIRSGLNRNVYDEGKYYNTYPQSNRKVGPMTKGPVFSVAGTVKVGAKTSFIFDSMFIIYDKLYSNVNYTELTPETNSGQPDFIYTPATYIYTVTNTMSSTTGLLVMPGMRFQKSERKAFQFCLAGVSIFGRNNTSFPFPMCSWFYKL
jgi:hypothetical protein